MRLTISEIEKKYLNKLDNIKIVNYIWQNIYCHAI